METEARKRAAVLISGRGSNLGALIAAAAAPDYPARIVLVIANRPEAGGLARAAEAGLATCVIHDGKYVSRAAFDAELHAELIARDVEIVCLAGFMRLLSAAFVEAWRDRMINIHPSLLPAFPGLHTHERALAAGATRHGATVHFVRAQMDTGPLIVQGAVPVLPGDTAEVLAARVLAVEHELYPLALSLVAGGAVRVDGEQAIVAEEVRRGRSALIWP